jgi:hypothetical protein
MARRSTAFNTTEKYKPRTNHAQPGSNGRVKGGQGVWDRDFPLDPYVVIGDPKTAACCRWSTKDEVGKQVIPRPVCRPIVTAFASPRTRPTCLPITPPADYDPKTYEIVARFIEACLQNGDDMDLRWFSKHDALPNDKWDFNTATFGGNLPGASHAWPAASYTEREKIAKKHENYHRGLLHFLATDQTHCLRRCARTCSASVCPKMSFTDTGGWPHQLYMCARHGAWSAISCSRSITPLAKSSRRSPSDSAATAPTCMKSAASSKTASSSAKASSPEAAAASVHIRSATTPSCRSGRVLENLLVTFALSASHTAFASIRMEPVFMITSQSAATAAVMALEDGKAVQEVDYEKLKARFVKDSQVVNWRE